MLVLIISLLYWTQTEGLRNKYRGLNKPTQRSGCSAAVSIIGENKQLSVGECFNLSCEFTCLGTQHVAQLWRYNQSGDGVSLVNVSFILSNVTMDLNICSAKKADTGSYQCKTQPPHAISQPVLIQITDNLTTRKSTQPTNSSNQSNSAACEGTQPCDATSQNGLQGQIWYWMLLGKTVILLLSFVSLAVKYKRG